MAKVTKKLAYGPREDFKQIIIGFSVYLKFNVYLGLKPGSIRSIFKYNCNKYKIMEYPVDLWKLLVLSADSRKNILKSTTGWLYTLYNI